MMKDAKRVHCEFHEAKDFKSFSGKVIENAMAVDMKKEDFDAAQKINLFIIDQNKVAIEEFRKLTNQLLEINNKSRHATQSALGIDNQKITATSIPIKDTLGLENPGYYTSLPKPLREEVKNTYISETSMFEQFKANWAEINRPGSDVAQLNLQCSYYYHNDPTESFIKVLELLRGHQNEAKAIIHILRKCYRLIAEGEARTKGAPAYFLSDHQIKRERKLHEEALEKQRKYDAENERLCEDIFRDDPVFGYDVVFGNNQNYPHHQPHYPSQPQRGRAISTDIYGGYRLELPYTKLK